MRALILILGCVAPDEGEEKVPGDRPEPPPPVEDTAVETIEEPARCAPGAADVYATEGQLISVVFACTGEASASTFSVTNLPAGATYDAETSTLLWTPGLAQAGNWDVDLAVVDVPGDVGRVRISVADAWSDPDNREVDPLTYEEEWGLPVLHLERPPNTGSEDDVATTMVWRGHTFEIGLKYRGASSLGYPKNSYTLSFPSDDEFEDGETDFVQRRKIVLTTLFDDNAYIRQKFVFDVWTSLSKSHPPMQAIFSVVYINGEYEGLYLLGDHVDGEYWEDAGHREDGNLYKAVDHSANFYSTYSGRPKSSLHSGYTKKEGDIPEGEPGAWDDLDALVDFVVNEPDETFATALRERMAVEEFMDWWILVTFTLSEDSGGKNCYLYNDPLAPMWHFAPWDFNHSWGQAWESSRTSPSTDNDFTGANNLFARMLADDTLGPALMDRLHAAFEGPLSEAVLQETAAAYYAEIDRSAARDWEKWEADYDSYYGWRSDLTSYEEERAYLIDWITARGVWMRRKYP